MLSEIIKFSCPSAEGPHASTDVAADAILEKRFYSKSWCFIYSRCRTQFSSLITEHQQYCTIYSYPSIIGMLHLNRSYDIMLLLSADVFLACSSFSEPNVTSAAQIHTLGIKISKTITSRQTADSFLERELNHLLPLSQKDMVVDSIG